MEKEDSHISVPRVYQKFSNRLCLVSEFIEGMSFYEFLKDGTQEEKNQIGYDLVKFCLQIYINIKYYIQTFMLVI